MRPMDCERLTARLELAGDLRPSVNLAEKAFGKKVVWTP